MQGESQTVICVTHIRPVPATPPLKSPILIQVIRNLF